MKQKYRKFNKYFIFFNWKSERLCALTQKGEKLRNIQKRTMRYYYRSLTLEKRLKHKDRDRDHQVKKVFV